jgi:hypothetical protein
VRGAAYPLHVIGAAAGGLFDQDVSPPAKSSLRQGGKLVMHRGDDDDIKLLIEQLIEGVKTPGGIILGQPLGGRELYVVAANENVVPECRRPFAPYQATTNDANA